MYTHFLADLTATLPITVVGLTGILVVLYDSFRHDAPELPWIAAAGMLLALLLEFGHLLRGMPPGGFATPVFSGHLYAGGYAAYVGTVILVGALGSLILSVPYLERIGHRYGEVYGLMLFATAGMMVFGSAGSFVSLYVGLETMSISFYVLTGLVREDIRSNESALKFFLLSAFSTGFFLYGIAMLYGASGTMMLAEMPTGLAGAAGTQQVLLWAGVGLLMTGFFFKVSAVPFHMWTPDVYQGAPTSITAFISTTAKVAAFAGLVLVLSVALPAAELAVRWEALLAVVAAITMVVGNVIALAQTNVKRLLAYSWIAHSGYVMAGLAAGTAEGFSASLFYLLAYTLMNLGAFGVLAVLEWDGDQGATQSLASLAGVGFRRPVLGVAMGVFMFALTGFPPLAGFIGKYLVFSAAVAGGLTWLAVIGVIASVISAYYYLRVLVVFWMRDPADAPVAARDAAFPVTTGTRAVLVACAVGLLLFGVFPGLVLDVTQGVFGAWAAPVAALP
jgi:NADH-quinone oxidoreductase subunit N